MPGFDGTGPRGYGPLSGSGRGYRLLQAPATAGQPLTGFAGLAGRTVAVFRPQAETDAAGLRVQARSLERMLAMEFSEKLNTRDPKGLQALIRKYQSYFRRPENINFYSEEDYRQAERKFVKFCLMGKLES